MAFTYSGDPASSNRDAVRFLLDDTNSTAAEFQDAKVAWMLAQKPNVYRAAAQGARRRATQATEGVASKTVGGLTLTYSERATKWLDIAESLEAQANKGAGGAIAPYSGGISKIDKELVASDDDFDKPDFYRDMWTNPGSETEYSYPRSST